MTDFVLYLLVGFALRCREFHPKSEKEEAFSNQPSAFSQNQEQKHFHGKNAKNTKVERAGSREAARFDRLVPGSYRNKVTADTDNRNPEPFTASAGGISGVEIGSPGLNRVSLLES
jgi:hypothetical protein